MAGYVRQSSADIVPTAVVRATPINNEYNALRDAFAQASGHRHDGTAAEGAYVPLISDSNNRNKVVTDSTNNRVGVFISVSSSAVEQVRFQDGAFVPVTDNDIDLGTSSLEFKDLYIDGTANIDSLVADTADINGGTIDATIIGGSTAAAGTFTTLVANTSVTTPALTVNTSAVIASADINAGTIDGTVIGGASAQAITGTTITATTGFVGPLTGAVTGNVTGDLTGNVTGNVTGNLTGNVTASSGSSTFNNVTINGTLNMDASSAATITNITDPTNAQDAATKNYVDTAISNLIDTAPGTLDTLNELAAALGDDPNFATTITNSIATKLALAGGTMSGAIAMGTNKITGLGNPTANQDAATKVYVDTADATKLSLSGGTMTGAIAMGTNKITGMGDPSSAQDAATKNYIDTLFGSTASAAASAAAAATSASNAATSESNAATSASNAASSASSAAASYDAFDDRYLGSKSSAPTLDNDGNALLTGALYFDTVANEMRVYTGSVWKATGSAVNGTNERYVYTATSSQTTFSATYDVGFVDVYLNGVKLVSGTDFTATSGTNIVLATGATSGDIIDIVAYGAFNVADTYTQATADARFLRVTNNLSDLNSAATARTNLGLVIGTDVQAYDADLTTWAGKTAPTGTVVGTSDTQTLTNKTLTSPAINTGTLTDPTIVGAITEDIYTITDGAAFEIDPGNGSIQLITLGAARTPKATNFVAGEAVTLMVDDGSAYTLTWSDSTFGGSGVVWKTDNGSAPTLNTSGYTVIVLWKVSTQVYGARVGNA
jgi:hypothetical protein